MAATFAMGLAATNTGNNLLYLIVAMMLSFIVVSGLLSEQCLRKVEVRRSIPRRLFAGEEASLAVTLRNGKRRLPALSLRLTDGPRGTYLVSLGPGETWTWRYPVSFSRRGVHPLPGVRLSTRYPFGLFVKTTRPLGATEVLVYPAIHPVRPGTVRTALAQGFRQRRRRGLGTSLFEIRPFRDGDDPRRIHWKSSAKTGDLMLKEFEAEEPERLTLLLEPPAADVPAEAVEADISLAASLAADLLGRGGEVRLLLAGTDTGFGRGDGHLFRLLEPLARYRPEALAGPPPPPPEGPAVQIVLGRGIVPMAAAAGRG